MPTRSLLVANLPGMQSVPYFTPHWLGGTPRWCTSTKLRVLTKGWFVAFFSTSGSKDPIGPTPTLTQWPVPAATPSTHGNVSLRPMELVLHSHVKQSLEVGGSVQASG